MPPVPAPKFALFIDAFEEMVTEAQNQIRQTEAMEHPYNVVRDALTALNLPNKITMKLHSGFLHIQMQALTTDELIELNRVVCAIGVALQSAGLHKNGIGAKRMGGTWHDITCTWYCKTGGLDAPDGYNATIYLVINIPPEGIVDLEVISHRNQIIDTRYELALRTHVPPFKERKGILK